MEISSQNCNGSIFGKAKKWFPRELKSTVIASTLVFLIFLIIFFGLFCEVLVFYGSASMASKLSSFISRKRIAKRVCRSCLFSSNSFATPIENHAIIVENPKSKPQNLQSSFKFPSFWPEMNSNFVSAIKFESFSTTDSKPSSRNFLVKFSLPNYVSVPVDHSSWSTVEMEENSSTHTFFQEILKQGMMGNIDKMEKLCYEIVKKQERYPFTDEALTQLIDSFRRNHRSMEGFWVLKILNNGKVPNIIMTSQEDYLDTLNDYLNYLFERDDVCNAISLFNEMPCHNTETFEIMLCGLCRRRYLEKFLDVLDKMIELEYTPSVGLNFYNKVIPFLCQSNPPQPSKAFQLFIMMKGLGFSPDYIIYEVLVKSPGLTGIADRLVDEMIECGLTPRDDLYASLVPRLCMRFGSNTAVEFLHKRSLSAPELHNEIILTSLDLRWFDEAVDYFEKMVGENLANIESWVILIKKFRGSGNDLKALEILKRAIPFHSCDICTNQSDAYDFLIEKISASTINPGELIRLYSLAYQFGIPCNPSTYNNVLLGLSQMGSRKAVLLFFSRMLIMGCCLNAEAYSVLIHRMCSENKIHHCAHLFDRMVGDDLVPSSVTLGKLLYCMACHSQLHIVVPPLHKIASEDGVLSTAMYYMLIRGLWKEAMCMLTQVFGRKVFMKAVFIKRMLFKGTTGTDGLIVNGRQR